MPGGLDLAPGQRVLAEVAVDVVDEGAHLPQRMGKAGRMFAGLQPPVAGVEDERVQLPVLFDNRVVLLLVQREQFGLFLRDDGFDRVLRKGLGSRRPA